ncbi:MAG: glycosyltransferase family 1 protein [Ketobacter sp.]|nr:glycosyltransferase family 1 protein [Ketobacter sp.]
MSDFIFALLGTGGDIWPALRIARELSRRGHRITVLAPEPFAGRAQAEGFGFQSIDTQEAWLNDVGSPAYWGPDGTRLGLLLGGYLHRPVQTSYEYIASRASQAPIVVCTRNAYGARFAAEHFDLACLCLGYSSTQFFDVGRLPYRHRILRQAPRWFQAGLVAWGDKSGDAMLLPNLNAMRKRYDLPAVSSFRTWSFFRHPGIALYPAWYDDVKILSSFGIRQTNFVFAHDSDGGPLPSTLQSFLDAGQAPMVVSFGTGVGHVNQRFRAVLEMINRTDWRAVFVSRFKANLPEQARSHPRIHVLDEVDFSALLPRCALLVHHGGIGTAAQAIRAKIPQVIAPFAYDQPDNGQRFQSLGLARLLSGRGLGSARLEGAVVDAMEKTDRIRLKEFGERIRTNDGSVLAADACEEISKTDAEVARQINQSFQVEG